MAALLEHNVGGLDFRLPCAICGRKFAAESLEKHQNICEKSSAKKRKVFNSAKQRASAEDGGGGSAAYVPPHLPPPLPPRNTSKKATKKKSPQGVQNGRSVLEPLKLSQGIAVPSPVTRGRLNGGDYIQCPSCERNFNSKAAERHIEWCREQSSRIPRSPPCPIAQDRLNARIQYKAPLPGRRKSSPIRVSGLNKSSWSPSSHTSLNDVYLPSITLNPSSGVKITGKAITAHRKGSVGKKPVGRTSSHVGSSNHSINGLIPSDSWEWMTSSNCAPAAGKQPPKTNANVKTKKASSVCCEADSGYDPFVSAQKQLEELMLSTCGSPTVEQSSPIIANGIGDSLRKNSHKSDRSSNWSLNSDKEVEEELPEEFIIGIQPHLEGDFTSQLINMSEGRPSRLARRTVSREEALFGTKNSSGSQDSDYGSLLMRRSPISPTRLSPSQRFGGNHNFDHNNLCMSTSSSEASLPSLQKAESKCSRFCHECGSKFPMPEAKFCCECGVKRFYAT